MTDTELFAQTENQISLFRSLYESHKNDLKSYPNGSYSIQSRITLQHCYNTLLRLNDLLAKPIQTDKN